MTTLACKTQDPSTLKLVDLVFWCVGIVVSLLSVCCVAASSPRDVKKARLLWTVGLRDDPDFRLHSKNPLHLEHASISFLDEGHLVLTFHDGRPWAPPFSLSGKLQT